MTIFLLWLLFFDANNLISRIKERKELIKLKAEREYYIEKIESDSEKLRELRTDNENLEKFAREQYKMKRADEDVYVVITPKQERENLRETKRTWWRRK